MTYGQTFIITQPGIFNYSCTAFAKCYTADNNFESSGDNVDDNGDTDAEDTKIVICPLARNITGFARGEVHLINQSRLMNT